MVVEVADWERSVVGFVEHKQFAIARLVLHVYFVAKQHFAVGNARGSEVAVPLQRAAQPEEFSASRIADVHDLAGGVGKLVDAKLAGNLSRGDGGEVAPRFG